MIGFGLAIFFAVGKILLLLLVILILADFLMLYAGKNNALTLERESTNKLSNGDENPIRIKVTNHYPFGISLFLIDEVPVQFQLRDFGIKSYLKAGEKKQFTYHLRPVTRGEYFFGNLNAFVKSVIGLVERRIAQNVQEMIPVYPAFLQLRKYELLAISNRLAEAGIKKIRKIGHNMEFDQIKEYVMGDDYRSLNWQATARKNQLMVNQYQEEKSQQVYSIIDKGRVMKMPFEGMTLLDYAINASLVLSSIAIYKQDKAGLIAFSQKVNSLITAGNNRLQMNKILETLYRQQTDFMESDFEQVYISVKRNISQRSLLVFYSNFETIASLERQLPYLRLLAKIHLLVVIFFENTEILGLVDEPAATTEAIYTKTIAEKFIHEKRQIVKELKSYGIHAVLSKPQHLTVDTINKYLELKARGLV